MLSSQRGFIPAVVLIVIAAVGLIAGVSLVGKSTSFFNRASDNPIQVCGGFAGLLCPDGYTCQYETEEESDGKKQPMPDMSGICVLDMPKEKPTATCKPRPACLDSSPRCLIPVTEDMCPPTLPTAIPASAKPVIEPVQTTIPESSSRPVDRDIIVTPTSKAIIQPSPLPTNITPVEPPEPPKQIEPSPQKMKEQTQELPPVVQKVAENIPPTIIDMIFSIFARLGLFGR